MGKSQRPAYRILTRRLFVLDARADAGPLPLVTENDENSGMAARKTDTNSDRLEQVVAAARRARDEREQSYRGQALKMYPWVCGRCTREFDRTTVQMLTVHHKDHNHDHNPPDGSNWELLCIYCHDNEHQRSLHVTGAEAGRAAGAPGATHTPFAELGKLLKPRD